MSRATRLAKERSRLLPRLRALVGRLRSVQWKPIGTIILIIAISVLSALIVIEYAGLENANLLHEAILIALAVTAAMTKGKKGDK
jgi:hypothetical protein